MFEQTYNFCIVTGRPSGIVPPILLLLRSLNEVVNHEVFSANYIRISRIQNQSDRHLKLYTYSAYKVINDVKFPKVLPSCPPKFAPLRILQEKHAALFRSPIKGVH